MKKKYLLALPVLAMVAFFGMSPASAFGGGMMGLGMHAGDPEIMATRWAEEMNQTANILGLSVDEVKANWANGLGLREIAKAKGISDADLQTKLTALRTEREKQWLQTLVTKGQITQAQADARLKFMSTASTKKMGKMRGQAFGRGR